MGSLDFDNIRPSRRSTGTLEIVFDGIGKDFGLELRSSLPMLGIIRACLALLPLYRSPAHGFLTNVLLGAKHDGL